MATSTRSGAIIPHRRGGVQPLSAVRGQTSFSGPGCPERAAGPGQDARLRCARTADTIRPNRYPARCPSPPDRRARHTLHPAEWHGLDQGTKMSLMPLLRLYALVFARRRPARVHRRPGKGRRIRHLGNEPIGPARIRIRRCSPDVDRSRSIGPGRNNQRANRVPPRRHRQRSGESRFLETRRAASRSETAAQ